MAAPTKKQVVQSSTLGAGVLVVAALLVMVNYFGWKYHQRWDWTGSKLYTLSEKSLNVLAALDKDVEAVVFMRPSEELYTPTKELLERYAAASPRFEVRLVDPDKNLAETQQVAQKYGLQAANVVVFEAGDERRVVETADLAEFDYSGMQMGESPRMTGFKGEQRFTGAILELQEAKKPKILFTAGHGEASLDSFEAHGLSQSQELLGKDNFELESWPSLGKGAVPDGTDLVVIAGPTSGFTPPELDVLSAYLAKGGRLLAMIDPTLPGGSSALVDTGLRTWLESYGVRLGDDIVVDPSNPLPFFGAETIFSSSYGSHAITKSLQQAQVPSVLALARSVGKGEVPAGYQVSDLVKTSPEGWGEKDLDNLRAGKKDPTDLPGPVTLAVVVEPVEDAAKDDAAPHDEELDEETTKPPQPTPTPADTAAIPKPRLVVFGDSDFASNSQIANAGNATLVADTFNWLVARQQALGIAPKTPEQVRLTLAGGQLSAIFWFVVGVLPLLSIVAGVAVFLRRRR
jgi:ABC-type uncharacterized transport system involved in gliding motility auxiliary subunit